MAPETGVQSQTQKMVLDAALLNTQYYKVRMKGKMELRPPQHLGVEAFEKRAFMSPLTTVG